jgi:hypothetical protein
MPWIRPQDQMPKENEPVLICDDAELKLVALYDATNDKWYSEEYTWFPHEIVYWMPIPESPNP